MNMGCRRHSFVENVSFGIFCLCLIGMIIFVHQCMEKYARKPEGVDISTKSQNLVEFPAMTLCPISSSSDSDWGKKSKPSAYNWTWLHECGVSKNFRENGQFIGNGSDDCRDPVTLWDNARPSLSDFGIEKVFVRTLDDNWNEIPVSENDATWKRYVTIDYGHCYSLVMPDYIKEKTVTWLWMEVNPSKTLYVLMHSNGFLNSFNPWWSVETAYNVLEYSMEVTYIGKKVLGFNGKSCDASEEYDFTSCLENEAYNEVMKEVGCITPFQGRNSQICRNAAKGRLAYDTLYRIMKNSSCFYPCKYLSNFVINKIEEPNHSSKTVWIGFKNLVQVHESTVIYTAIDLFAAVGGYVGLFLGFSLLHIRDAFVKILQNIIKRFQ